MGITEASSSMMSNPSAPTSGSSDLAQNARTWSSSAAMRRGVKTAT